MSDQINLSRPSLQALSYVLRNKGLWPQDFGPWNFTEPSGCAMGLARCLWPDAPSDMTVMFNLSYSTVCRVFYGSCNTYKTTYFSDITAEMVADMIDRIDYLVPLPVQEHWLIAWFKRFMAR